MKICLYTSVAPLLISASLSLSLDTAENFATQLGFKSGSFNNSYTAPWSIPEAEIKTEQYETAYDENDYDSIQTDMFLDNLNLGQKTMPNMFSSILSSVNRFSGNRLLSQYVWTEHVVPHKGLYWSVEKHGPITSSEGFDMMSEIEDKFQSSTSCTRYCLKHHSNGGFRGFVQVGKNKDQLFETSDCLNEGSRNCPLKGHRGGPHGGPHGAKGGHGGPHGTHGPHTPHGHHGGHPDGPAQKHEHGPYGPYGPHETQPDSPMA